MKILIEQSGYDLLNFGDLAMLLFTVEQVRKRWPDSHVSVLTSSEQALKSFIPDVNHLIIHGRDALLMRDRLFTKLSSKLTPADHKLWRATPGLAQGVMHLKSKLTKNNLEDLTRFYEAIKEADFVIASGGGYITDEFPKMVEGVCATLALAQRLKKPTAMFGQGLGPLKDPSLVKFAEEVIPKVNVLGLREPVFSPQVAKDLGVPSDKVIVTGDNATDFAFRQRSSDVGDQIGFNVRVAGYSRVGQEELAQLKDQVRTIGEKTGASFIPILISLVEKDGEQSAALCPPDKLIDHPITSPNDAIKAVSRCRIVITGSYHAAVFAFGQGIPVIGLAKSAYYKGKFEGLRGLYPNGMQVVNISDPAECAKLADIAADLYGRAATLREEILEQSADIVSRSAKVYSDFFDSVESRRQKASA